ncbi:serine/threonine-protein kinase SMG1 [Anthonomus grandis grandis]|uniref:serine/threonine-protein kinase SMG1 n=1 Tax=Anthonomus grandis grandis TaxID=2921223 RepID=UPI0021651542|nr:serine/threonine-protein kinase SMG1 [Anthonomus grandis grandis]
MISSNASIYKLKSSKSYRDVPDAEYSHSDESGDQEINEKFNARERGYRNSGATRNRTRSTEFRSTRTTGGRAACRPGRRGDPPSRRSDRDYSDGYYSTRKYESSRNEGLPAFRGKFYEPEKKSDIKLNLPEDTRISKLLRRLNIETCQENSLQISKKLLEVLLLPDNAAYIRKAFHILGESMYEILMVSPGLLAKQQAARALGRMGYIMGQEGDFDRYHNWLFSRMQNTCEETQILLMSSFKETLAMEQKNPILEEHIENLINNLVAAIEVTDNAEVFKAILETLVNVVEVYPNEFYTQFRDTIDLLFGWHVDHTQPLSNIEFISKNMQKLSHHFKFNIEFSVSLVENFLEDISNYTADLNKPESIDHVTVFLLALNTVLKCLGISFHPANNKIVTSDFIVACLGSVIKTVTDALDYFTPENLIIAANDVISQLLSYLETKPQSISNSIYNLIDMELVLINDLYDNAVISMLLLISKVVKELSANLPMELIEKLIGPKSDIVKLRSSPYRHIQNSVICVYQALLNLKNVSLLQEAYRYIWGDLERFYVKIVPKYKPIIQNNPYGQKDAEESTEDPHLTVMFLLRCLSQLTNASSIIVMWALKPSILELVGLHLRPHDAVLSKRAPYIQYSLLYLLFSHCKCYNHFISNSALVTNKQEMNRFALTDTLNIGDVPNTSPNSGNFGVILEVIYKCLKIETSTEVALLLLQWLNDILVNSDSYLEAFYLDEKFGLVTEVLVKCGYHFNGRITEAVCENLEKLLSNKQLAWNNVFLSNVSDLCKLHMTSNNVGLRERYSRLLSNVPWDIAIVELNNVTTMNHSMEKTCNSKDFNKYMVYLAQNLHLNGSVDGEMCLEQFKNFMRYLLYKNNFDESFLEEIFTTCWTQDYESHMNMELFYDLAMNSRQVLISWCTMEAAQVCVNYKLRTPLGKPNETFMKIESALNELGNDLVMMKKTGDRLNEKSGNRVRMLLQFIENLEKSIYNASEGCAVAMPQANKNVKAFFIANANTCNEWLSRIRMVVIHIALHSGENSLAYRHSQCMLKEIVIAGKAKSVEFERVAMFATLALLNLKESEALYGLYTWCKMQTGKRFQFIKYSVDQAAKRYEIAVEGFKRILEEAKDERDSNTSKEDKGLIDDIINFIQDQVVVCYKELNNWADLFEWYEYYHLYLGNVTENGKKYWFHTTDWECNKSLYKLELDEHSLTELGTWRLKDEETTWSLYENLTTTETNLFNYALNLAAGSEDSVLPKIEQTLYNVQKNVRDLLPLAPNEFLQNYSLLQYVAIGLRNVAQNLTAHTVFLVSENFEKEIDKVDTSILRKILWWSEYFGKVQNQGFDVFCSNLRLDIIKRARKEKNFELSSRQIYKFFRDKGIEFSCPYVNRLTFQELATKLSDITICTLDTAKAMSEVIKVCYHSEREDSRQTALNLCATVSTIISKYAELCNSNEHRKVSSKILLKLASWMQNNDSVNITEINSALGKLIMVLPEIGLIEPGANNIIPLNEMAVGKLLQFSAHQCPSLAKSWNAFGTWCYRWGKKTVDHGSIMKNNLTEEHCLEIKALLPFETSEKDVTKIIRILSQTRSAIIGEEDIESNEINTTDMIQAQLQTVGILEDASEDQLRSLVQIWKSTQKSMYNYYSLSAEAYFKYLHLVMKSENVSKSNDCDTITITLRLLRLMVKYALELQSTLEEGLQSTPTEPWKVIIPQLFSRLNHPESYVRLRVSDLLCRVAEDAPQLITFPAVVGALEGGVKFDFSEIKLPKDCLSQNNEDPDENDLDNDEDNYESDTDECRDNTLQNCFKAMVDTLSKQDPETISQVQTLVKELRRITLLWDELWLGTLAQHQSEIGKRQRQLEYEIEKVNENSNLSKEEKASLIFEKHRIIIKPIVYVLEQLNDVTSVEPETPHEKQFQEKYQEDIKAVIEKLKNPQSPEHPQDSLSPLKQLQKKFQQKFHKRASYSLKMQDISPVLHSVKDTLIAMPGIATNEKKTVTISHVSNVVSILPTKTKPKKLIFYGSDGQTYTYLFKGLEDLHLDERIMQFLSIANTMMAQNADPSGHNLYRARHYSVIPLGPRSGLISWVDGTTPVFALYKRWQQRELAKPTAKGTQTVPRPSELFYNKLVEHGVQNIDNRKEWPQSVLKEVLTELMAETPSDLISKELWCKAVSPSSWWQVVKRYSYSVAVMSIIGYIIGLGDRHLDNVLIDLMTGDVVHIDYNVCFEKGKTLRVPEKVPFRLTPNIRDALGVTGVEGIFRVACENVLKTMRKGRETLLTLLEAFVYDPLIDWTVGGEVLAGTTFGGVTSSESGGKRQTKKELEREVTLAMFDVRCVEMKAEWQENKEDILLEIPTLLDHLQECLVVAQELSETEDQLQDLHQQLSLVKEAEAQGKKHSLYKLPTLYEAYVKSQESMNSAKKALCDIIKDCESHSKIFKQLLNSYENQQFTQWLNELKFNVSDDSTHIFDLVKEFLHNAGKDDVVTQCEQSELEVAQLSQHLNLHSRKCIQTFQDYFSLLVQCPRSYINYHRMDLYSKWANHLLETKSTEGCDNVIAEFKLMHDRHVHNTAKIVNVAFTMDNYYKDTLLQVNKSFEELSNIRARDPSNSIETSYAQTKKNIEMFLSQDKIATNAFKFVVAGDLLILNKMLLSAEITAQKSGNLLLKLTSRDGDWFLDDLLMNSLRAVELVNNLPLKPEVDDPRLFQITTGIKTANLVYKGLYDLNFNFHTIILPESMKKIQADEDSVQVMIADLRRVVDECEIPIHNMIAELEKLLTCVLMHVDIHTSYDYVLEKLVLLRSNYFSLIPNQPDALSQGKMLLMGFNGLFEKVNQEITNLVSTLGTLDVPKSWKKLDHVIQAKNISPHIFKPQVKSILENIFFLKRIVAIKDFFTLAQQMSQSIKGSAPTMIYSDDTLTKPVKQFIAEFISRQLLGITPEALTYCICLLLEQVGIKVTHEVEQKDIGAESKVPLEEIYQKAYNSLTKQGAFTPNVFSEASSLENSLKISWEKIQAPKKLEQKLAVLQSSTFRLQSQMAVHNLIYDDVLSMNNFPSARAKFVMDMQNELTQLQSTFKQLKEAREKQQKLVEKAYQRLNWAKGANPNVVEILAAFETAVQNRETQLNLEQKIASNILESYGVILQHEVLRSSNVETTKKYDQSFLTCYEKWRQSCEYAESNNEALLPAEESILNMLSLDLVQNPKWLHQVSLHITDVIAIYQKRLADKKDGLFTSNDNLTTLINNFKAIFNIHSRLMQDVKGLLKTMAKIDEYSKETQYFIYDYKKYLGHFNELFGNYWEELDKKMIEDMIVHLEYVRDNTEDIYEGLLGLQQLRTNNYRPRLRKQSCMFSCEIKKESKNQQRNAYALNVWRRVKMKLEGRDPDSTRKCTAQEQVDYVIREATSLDNLALLYEGWTPWV